MSRFLHCLVALSLVLPAAMLRPVPAAAQTSGTATLTGVVTDAAGKALGGARIVVTSATFSQSVATAPDGSFKIFVPPDTYSVSARANGFQLAREDGVTAVAGQSVKVKFALANATLSTIGQVRATRATSINQSPAAVASVSSQTFVDQGQAQVVNVLDQLPGIEINRASSNAPGANTSISIRGALPYESQILIDGHPVVSSANGASGFNATFINSLLLDDVEVTKGTGNLPNTIEDAVGGSLNFKTAAITSGPTANLLGGYDSYNGGYFAAKASDSFGKLGVLVGYAENETPGYIGTQTVYSGGIYPTVGPGDAYNPHLGVINFSYPATQDFGSRSQLAKLSYNFSPQTSLLLSQYSTQTNNDETGTNDQYVNATIVPCLDTPPTGFAGTPNCTEPGGMDPNYTSSLHTGQIGKLEPLNLYAPYPDTTEFDNEPIYSAEFRTVLGPGSLLARYYTGAINRIITQKYSPAARDACPTPACPNTNDFTTTPPTYNEYDGAPYVEDTIDVLHGLDAQYTIPFGNSFVTAGFDRHVDNATFGEYNPVAAPPTFPFLGIQSLAYSLRGSFALTPKLTLQSGNYFSSTTYVGSRFDPRDSLTYRITPRAIVRASYGSAYVAPYYGIINPTPYVSSGVLNLATGPFKPETSSGYDIGGDLKFDRDTLFSADAYLTNIYNRYASVSKEVPMMTFGGAPYTVESQEGNQAVVREEGLEVQILRSPRVGFGFHSALDFLRDYAYNQSPTVGVDNIFSGTPGNYVQLPGYPFFKARNDVFYNFDGDSQARLSATSYGQDNSFGERAFTEFDGEVRLPLKAAFVLNIGCTNLFNHDDYNETAIYNGGPTFAQLGGGSNYTSLFFVQPRTLYIQLQRSIGPNGTAALPRSSL